MLLTIKGKTVEISTNELEKLIRTCVSDTYALYSQIYIDISNGEVILKQYHDCNSWTEFKSDSVRLLYNFKKGYFRQYLERHNYTTKLGEQRVITKVARTYLGYSLYDDLRLLEYLENYEAENT